MSKVVARKQGSSIVITVPAEYDVKPDQEFTVKQLRDGGIVYVPVQSSFPQPRKATTAEVKTFNNQIGIVDDEGKFGREFSAE